MIAERFAADIAASNERNRLQSLAAARSRLTEILARPVFGPAELVALAAVYSILRHSL